MEQRALERHRPRAGFAAARDEITRALRAGQPTAALVVTSRPGRAEAVRRALASRFGSDVTVALTGLHALARAKRDPGLAFLVVDADLVGIAAVPLVFALRHASAVPATVLFVAPPGGTVDVPPEIADGVVAGLEDPAAFARALGDALDALLPPPEEPVA